jgi:hypothetical protein
VLDEGCEELGAGVVGVALEDVVEGREAEVAVEASVVDKAGSSCAGQTWREVEGGAGGAGGGDAALAGDVAWL